MNEDELKELFNNELSPEQMLVQGKMLYDMLGERHFKNEKYKKVSDFLRVAKLVDSDTVSTRVRNLERLLEYVEDGVPNMVLWTRLYYFTDSRYEEITAGTKFSKDKHLKEIVLKLNDKVKTETKRERKEKKKKPKPSRVVESEEEEEIAEPQLPAMEEEQMVVEFPQLPADFPPLVTMPPPEMPPLPQIVPEPALPEVQQQVAEPWWRRLIPVEDVDIALHEGTIEDEEEEAKFELATTVQERARTVRQKRKIIDDTNERMAQQSRDAEKREREAVFREMREEAERQARAAMPQRVDTIPDLIQNAALAQQILMQAQADFVNANFNDNNPAVIERSPTPVNLMEPLSSSEEEEEEVAEPSPARRFFSWAKPKVVEKAPSAAAIARQAGVFLFPSFASSTR
jgi:hypothetical protein